MKSFDQLREKHLTPAEMKKREEVAKAIKRENPNMPMAQKMAIATATAKKVAEERVISGGYRDKDGKYHPPQTASSIAKDRLAKKAAIMKKTATAMRSEAAFDNESKSHDSHYEKQTPAVRNALDKYTRQGMSYKQAHAKISSPTGGHTLRKEITPLHEETAINEAADMSKLKLLARAGLVDQKNVDKLMSAFKTMQAGKPLTQQQKDLVISSYGELASIVTGDSQIFQKAKKAVAEAMQK